MDEEIRPDESIVDRLTSVERLLSEYEDKIHISKIKVIEPDLSIGREMIMSMHPEDIQALAWQYAEYSLAIQKEINKHQSRFNWSEANLKRLLEKECQNYPGWKWEERQSNVLNENSYAQKLFDLKVKSKIAIDRLAFLPSKIQFLAELAKDISYTKRQQMRIQNGN